MDKQMIEEMAKVVRKYYSGFSEYKVAEEIYRILIPEGAVVLTREEYEKLIALKEDYVKGYEAGVEEGWDNARKETAEKIFDKLYTWLDLDEIEKDGFVTIKKFDFLRKYREICKEILEGK